MPATIMFFGTYDVRTHPRVEVLMEGLRAAGDRVTEYNRPLGATTASRVKMLTRPWLAAGLVLRLGIAWVRLWRAARSTSPPDAIVVGYMGHLDVHLARRLFSRASIVLDHMVSLSGTALDRRASSGILLRALAKIDAAALAAADLVVVDTDRHLDALPEASRTKAVVVPVGAPHAWFREPVRRDRGELSVVFFGLYTPLQGAETIGRAIAILGERQGAVAVTMIGTGQDYDAARAAAGSASGVAWIDWVASERLPDVVAAHDVCLGIFGTGDKAHRVVPNKVFQGAAAGCAIVTSDTAPQRDILGRDAILVPPGDPDALASALLELSRDADLLWRLRSAAYRRASRSFRPEVVVQPLRARLGNVTMPP